MATVCLNMIVKNAEATIERCLKSIAGQVDYWVIVDTGSTDATMEIVQRVMDEQGVPGELHSRQWRNFAYNRNEAFQLAEKHADYVLVADARMELHVLNSGWKFELVDAPAYYALQQGPSGQVPTLHLIKSNLKGSGRFRYWGAANEYLDTVEPLNHQLPLLNGLMFLDYVDASLNAAKLERNVTLLQEEIKELDELVRKKARTKTQKMLFGRKDSLVQRDTYYLAQSQLELGKLDEAKKAFEQRLEQGGWDQEVWASQYYLGAIAEAQGASRAEVIDAYLQAYNARPFRAEPLYNLAFYLRIQGQNNLAYLYASAAAKIPMTSDVLAVEPSVYQWRAKDELAVIAFNVGLYQECAQLCRELLAQPVIPEADRQRIMGNLGAAEARLTQYI